MLSQQYMPPLQSPDFEDQNAYQVNVPSPHSMELNGRSQLVPTIGNSLLNPQLSQPTGSFSGHMSPQYAKGGHAVQHPGLGSEYERLYMMALHNLMPAMHEYYAGHAQHYAKGGLAREAEKIRAAGTDGDTILAHINPLEAMQLAAQAGGTSINPHTGLPSYKFRPFKAIKKIVKPVLQVAAPFVGGALAGPAGAALGGAGAGLLGGGKNKFRNALIGGGLGYVGAGGLGRLGGVGEVIPNVNKAIGLSNLIKPMGSYGALAGSAPAAASAGTAAKTAAAAGAANAAAQSGAAGGVGGLGDFFNMSNIGTIAGLGALAALPFAKKEIPKEESLSNFVQRTQPQWREDQKYRPVKPLKRALRDIEAEEYLRPGAPELTYFEETNPEFEYMAHGGYLDGHTGGQADDIPARLSDGEFVISADVVSHLGDGNNKAGAKKLYSLMHNVRQHKTSKGGKGLPPKAKSLSAYMKAREA